MSEKHDQDKLRWDLLQWAEVEKVVKVLTIGAAKYSDNGWKDVVKDNPDRYFAALHRHLVEYQKGNKIDDESNIEHLAHVVCNALILMWNDNTKIECKPCPRCGGQKSLHNWLCDKCYEDYISGRFR